jgi:hypothetical protein
VFRPETGARNCIYINSLNFLLLLFLFSLIFCIIVSLLFIWIGPSSLGNSQSKRQQKKNYVEKETKRSLRAQKRKKKCRPGNDSREWLYCRLGLPIFSCVLGWWAGLLKQKYNPAPNTHRWDNKEEKRKKEGAHHLLASLKTRPPYRAKFLFFHCFAFWILYLIRFNKKRGCFLNSL